MSVLQTLTSIGLSDGESKVYLALLKLGAVPVSKIKEETNLHRTTIYDFVEKLMNKGLVNYVITNNIRLYKASQPEKMMDFVKDKERKVKEVLPELKELASFHKDELQVEVHKGKEGFRTMLDDFLRVRKNMLAFGVDEEDFRKHIPIIMEQFLKREAKAGLKERVLVSDDTTFVYPHPHMEYRYIPKEYFGPSPTIIYGDRVVIINWEPLTTIVMKNKTLADGYRKHIEFLWKTAKKRPKSRQKLRSLPAS